MRRVVVLFSLLFLPWQRVWALHPASADDLRAIQDKLDQANLIQYDLADSSGNDLSIRRTKRDLDLARLTGNKLEIEELDRQIQSLIRQRDLARCKAIHMTLAAYGIVPTNSQGRLRMPHGTIVVPLFAGRTATWIAIAGDNKKRQAIKPDGTVTTIDAANDPVTGKEPNGVTDLDGVTTILSETFERDLKGNSIRPLDLALLLIHEQRHFKQYVTPGKGDKLHFNAAELDAHQADLGDQFGPKNPLGLSPEELQTYKDNELGVVEEYRKAKWYDRFKRKVEEMSGHGEVIPTYRLPRVSEELAAIKKGAKELEAQIQWEAAERKAAREALVATPPGEPYIPPPVAMPPGMPVVPGPGAPRATPPMAPVGSNLGLLADAACRSSGALPYQEFQRWLDGYPDGIDWGRREVHGCADELYNELMQRNVGRENVTYDWLRSEAARLRQKYAPPPSGGGGEGPRGNDGGGGGMHGNPRPPRPSPNPWKGS